MDICLGMGSGRGGGGGGGGGGGSGRLLGRALVLPMVYCTCEIGFWIKHVREDCKGSDHKGLELPYKCPIDHFLEPNALHSSPYAHRERSFLANPRTPEAVRRSTVRVRSCGGGAPAGAPTCDTVADGGTIRLAVLPRESTLVHRLSHLNASVLHFDDIELALGDFEQAATSVQYHEDAQSLLSTWCCTADANFRAGMVPYILPPLPTQRHWRGRPALDKAAFHLKQAFETANDSRTAASFETCRRAGDGSLCVRVDGEIL